MVVQTKIYEGTPVGAVFEASQKSIRNLKFTLFEEIPTAHAIFAKSPRSMKSSGQKVTLSMVEIGSATELTVGTLSGQLIDWGEGKEIIESIISNVDDEIEKIRAEGRISPAAGIVYALGQATQQKPEVKIDAPTKKEGSSGGSWMFRVVAVLAALWLFNSEAGSKFLTSIIGSFVVETDIAKYDCQKVSSLFKGEALQNAFGGSFKVIAISSVKEVSKTNAKIVCTGKMDLSNGTTQKMRMSVEKGTGPSEVRYRAEPM